MVFNNKPSLSSEPAGKTSRSDQYLLWIDGVGCYLLCLADNVTIGGPALKDDSADIRLMANLSRQHVIFQRHGEGYLIQPLAETRVNDRTIYEPTSLNNDYRIRLGSTVELGFKIPTALSTSAVIELHSGHRPTYSIDGIVLMNDNCLLGGGSENHVQCKDWSSTVILFRRNNELCCKCRESFSLDGNVVKDYASLTSGSVVSGEDFQFRIEGIELQT